MNTMTVRAVAFALISIAVLSQVGCTTMTPVEVQPGETDRKVEIGDNVRVITKDGQEHIFKVTALTSDSIVGDDVEVSYANITRLEVKELDGWRTAGVSIASLAGAFVVASGLAILLLILAF